MNVLVTGGSRGIGKEIVRQLIETGQCARVFFTVRDSAAGESTISDVSSSLSNKGQCVIKYYLADVTDDRAIENLVQDLQKDLSGDVLDVLINNAGYATKGPALDSSIAEKVFAVNYYGVKNVTETILPLIRSPGGRIVNVSSRAGKLKNEGRALEIADGKVESKSVQDIDSMAQDFLKAVADDQMEERGWAKNGYATSKMLLNAWTRIRAAELFRDKGIEMNAFCPGWCKTDMGGEKAPRTAAQGAEGAVWMATELKGVHGQFYADKERIDF